MILIRFNSLVAVHNVFYEGNFFRNSKQYKKLALLKGEQRILNFIFFNFIFINKVSNAINNKIFMLILS